MYTLRKITGEGVQMNFCLGKSYTVITEEKNPKQYEELFIKGCKSDEHDMPWDKETCFGAISAEGTTHYLFRKQKNFIMTESGATFEYIKG